MTLVEIEGQSFFYQIHGDGDPVVLLHGLGSSSRDWELQVPVLAGRYKVVTLDMRGHGLSAKTPGPYSISLFSSDIANLMQTLNLPAAHVIGMSLGGMVAFQLALDYPERVNSLIIINSVPDLVARNWKDRISFLQRLLIVNFLGMEKMGEVLAERFLPGADQAALRELFIKRWAENHKPSYLASLKAAYGWSVVDRLEQIRCPTLVIAADGDYFPLADKEAYTRLIPGARLEVIPNSRHALPAEKPEELNRLLDDFLMGVVQEGNIDH